MALIEPFQRLTTASGEKFCALGQYPTTEPAPLLLVFAADAATTLGSTDFNRTATALASEGVLCVSVDLPCHGDQRRPDEPPELSGWRRRIENGEPLVDAFVARARSVLDELIQGGQGDESRVAVAGTSRGGFLAMHLASRDKRVLRVAAYAPVTDLMALDEFNSTPASQAAKRLALHNHSMSLVEKDLWICVGRRDPRINERLVHSLVRSIKANAEAMSKPVRVELQQYEADEHTAPPSVYAKAAQWLAGTLKKSSPMETA